MLHLKNQAQVTQFHFFAGMWHVSDMTREHIHSKKAHGIKYPITCFGPCSHTDINRMCILETICQCNSPTITQVHTQRYVIWAT